jgi:hypothetical protein
MHWIGRGSWCEITKCRLGTVQLFLSTSFLMEDMSAGHDAKRGLMFGLSAAVQRTKRLKRPTWRFDHNLRRDNSF